MELFQTYHVDTYFLNSFVFHSITLFLYRQAQKILFYSLLIIFSHFAIILLNNIYKSLLQTTNLQALDA
jgi:hypothetical protein